VRAAVTRVKSDPLTVASLPGYAGRRIDASKTLFTPTSSIMWIRFLLHADRRALIFAFHEAERIGPNLLATMLKDARISPENFRRLVQVRVRTAANRAMSQRSR
jgi:hypothetical protein